MTNNSLEQWLQELPLDEAVEIDGESVFLKVQQQGAELGVYLANAYTGRMLAEALRTGFQSALSFDAGLGVSGEGNHLTLSRWLPHAESWTDASEALEDLLNQAAMWRAAMAYSGPPQEDKLNRNEARVRQLFSEE